MNFIAFLFVVAVIIGGGVLLAPIIQNSIGFHWMWMIIIAIVIAYSICCGGEEAKKTPQA